METATLGVITQQPQVGDSLGGSPIASASPPTRKFQPEMQILRIRLRMTAPGSATRAYDRRCGNYHLGNRPIAMDGIIRSRRWQDPLIPH